MEVISKIKDMQILLNNQRGQKNKIAFIPTMGNLHQGHLSLIELAKTYAEFIVVSIFVNPTQFHEDEDFDVYPRTIKSDLSKLKDIDIDLVFLPEISTIYPYGIDVSTQIIIPGLSQELCGKVRPGHFNGVTSVVLRLFNIIEPDIAVFGQKDYQQKIMLGFMVKDLSLNIRIVDGPTIREEDGLAMSSRNQLLSSSARSSAKDLYVVLQSAKQSAQMKGMSFSLIEDRSVKTLESHGFVVDYFSIREKKYLVKPDKQDKELIILASAKIENVRLIDNVFLSL
ncbi:MAG TPA: pantoate--beta-alanine ligase [Woeseiaceae bacterium]|nr:pantoate--beta-alanine ligase [Woeseiaceae bacterium]